MTRTLKPSSLHALALCAAALIAAPAMAQDSMKTQPRLLQDRGNAVSPNGPKKPQIMRGDRPLPPADIGPPKLTFLSPDANSIAAARQPNGRYRTTFRVSIDKAHLEQGWVCCDIGPWSSPTTVTSNQITKPFPMQQDPNFPNRSYFSAFVEFTTNPNVSSQQLVQFRAWPYAPNGQSMQNLGSDIQFFTKHSKD
ncbi:MAG: hypothetical protein V4709_12735 [Pseudomonadota bacterium]